jgi:hypothetical protein
MKILKPKTCQKATLPLRVLIKRSAIITFVFPETDDSMDMPTPGEIESGNRYRLIMSLEYGSVADFVIGQLSKLNPVIVSFYIVTAAALAWALILRSALGDGWTIARVLPYTLAGLVAVPLLLIPVHEGIHILVFSLLGGRDIRIGADLSNFMIYVTAHRHVVGSGRFLTIALSPMIVISSAFIAAILLLPPQWKWSLALALTAHTTMCAGDIAMAAFYWSNRARRILTWDDADKKIAFFYEEIKPIMDQ